MKPTPVNQLFLQTEREASCSQCWAVVHAALDPLHEHFSETLERLRVQGRHLNWVRDETAPIMEDFICYQMHALFADTVTRWDEAADKLSVSLREHGCDVVKTLDPDKAMTNKSAAGEENKG